MNLLRPLEPHFVATTGSARVPPHPRRQRRRQGHLVDVRLRVSSPWDLNQCYILRKQWWFGWDSSFSIAQRCVHPHDWRARIVEGCSFWTSTVFMLKLSLLISSTSCIIRNPHRQSSLQYHREQPGLEFSWPPFHLPKPLLNPCYVCTRFFDVTCKTHSLALQGNHSRITCETDISVRYPRLSST